MKLFGLNITRSEKRASIENPSTSLDDPAVFAGLGFGDGGLPVVTPLRAVQTSAVYACVRVLAESIASLPLHVYKMGPGGKLQKADEEAEYALLNNSPNSYQTSNMWREQAMFQAALWGKSICEIQRDWRTKRVIGLYPIPAWEAKPELVEKLVHGVLTPVKIWNVGGRKIEDENIFHVPAPGWDGLDGRSPIALHRATLGMSLSAEEYGANFYRKGTRLSGVLQHPKTLTNEVAERLRQSWDAAYAGTCNSGKVAVLEEDMKFFAMSMPLTDAQFIETRKFQVEDVARIFRVPPHMVGDLTHATFSNIEHQSIEFVKHTMLPWIARWEQEFKRKIFTDTALLQDYSAKFNIGGLMRGDMASRYRSYAIARQWGWMSANDVRELEDQPPVEGGDVYLTPMNMSKADDLEQYKPIDGNPDGKR